MSILLIKTSSRAISGTLSSDFTFYHWKACPARFRRLFFRREHVPGQLVWQKCLRRSHPILALVTGDSLLPLLPQPSLAVCSTAFQAPPHSYSNLWCIFSRYRSRTFRRCRFFLGRLRACVRACSFTFTFCSSVNRKRFLFWKIFADKKKIMIKKNDIK